MEKKKILYLITQSEWGGAQKYVFDLARNFRDEFEVVVAFGGKGRLKKLLDKEEIQNITLSNLVREINPWKDFRAFWEICRLIKKEKPDIVHTNSSKAEILGNLSAALARVPKIVHTAHGFVFNEPMRFWKKRFYIFLERWANKFTSAIICVSDYDRAKALLHRIAPAKKLITIHNGIDAEKFYSEKKEPPIESGKFIITTIANFYPTKGLPYLIEAAGLLSPQFNDLEFWILGDGKERPFLEKLIRHHALKNVKLWGSKDEKGAYLKNSEYLEKSDLFVLPSVKEGFPYTILEAMAAGLPIVATRVGGVPEAITDGENGFLLPPADSYALARKISDLRESYAERSKMSRNNREKVRKLFSLETMLQKTKEVYDKK
jgi:glycosyltransferase involved in cell wall biosynthesis